MEDGVAAPGLPGAGQGVGLDGGDAAQAAEHGDVAARERVGPAQRAHRDVVRRPGADAGKRDQALEGGVGIGGRAAVERERARDLSGGERDEALAARAGDPERPAIRRRCARARRAGAGDRRVSAACGVAIGSPNAPASRPAIVVAAFTVICCPRMARTAISNPSNAPGTRRPGFAATSGARTRVLAEVALR